MSECPLGEGGSPKGRGWIRLEEAVSGKQRMHTIREIAVCIILQLVTATTIRPAALPRAVWSKSKALL